MVSKLNHAIILSRRHVFCVLNLVTRSPCPNTLFVTLHYMLCEYICNRWSREHLPAGDSNLEEPFGACSFDMGIMKVPKYVMCFILTRPIANIFKSMSVAA